jgi:hypothetical protein
MLRSGALTMVAGVSGTAACGGAGQSDLFTEPSGTTSEGGLGDGGQHVAEGSGGAPDTGAPTGKLTCGTGECTPGTEVCCRTGVAAPFDYECSVDACPSGALSIPCDNTAQCTVLGSPEDVCCGTYGADSKINQISCLPASECTTTSDRTSLCNKNAQDPCPTGETCKTSTLTLPGYDLCIPQ